MTRLAQKILRRPSAAHNSLRVFAKNWNSLRCLVIVKREIPSGSCNRQNLNFLWPNQATRWISQASVNELLLSLICIPHRDVRSVLRDDCENIAVHVPSEASAKTLKDDSLLQLSLPVENCNRSVIACCREIIRVGSTLPHERHVTRAVRLIMTK